ncbi:MAG: ketopantoate reductase family protein [Burkholderiaceae bacterium]|nr:ketopantoate reductase family protein [Burkholderiaceae bacterium]
MVSQRFRAVAVVGAGAVGSFFGAMLARAGHRVTLIGRPAHVQAIERDGLRLEMAGRTETIRLAASSELAAVRGADLVLFCVKSTDTDTVAQQMAAHLAPEALVLSLQNGGENAATIAARVSQPVVPAVVYVAVAMPAPGCVAHHGRGDLVIGALRAAGSGTQASPAEDEAATEQRLQPLADFLAAAGVPVRISDDLMAELWSKLMVNCAYNAISGLAQANYGQLAALPAIRELQQSVVREVVAVAAAEGIDLALAPSLEAMARIAVAMRGQLSSTAQDMARHKPSEIDHLNGFVSRRGRELGVPTPVNETLYALVKLVEAGYARD